MARLRPAVQGYWRRVGRATGLGGGVTPWWAGLGGAVPGGRGLGGAEEVYAVEKELAARLGERVAGGSARIAVSPLATPGSGCRRGCRPT